MAVAVGAISAAIGKQDRSIANSANSIAV